MGRKNKKSNNTTSSSEKSKKQIPNHLKSKLNPLIQNVLEQCSSVNVQPNKEFEAYKKIFPLLQEIRYLQKDYVLPLPKREEHWTDFYHWCLKHGADFSSVTVKENSKQDCGLFAERDLKACDFIISVPRKIIMSVEAAKNSKLGLLVEKNIILQQMPNVLLALYIIMEYLDTCSFWRPYISILPSSYDTVLYYNIEELELLQRSPILESASNLCRSIARQYTYFYEFFQNDVYAKSLNIGQYFTYDLYRWAVSTVMTRQNSIPLAGGEASTTALVPLWDMCNHAEGKFSTDFNLEKDCLEAYAMKDYTKGEEVYIFYGPRSNAELFLHNGFVYPGNDRDHITIQLAISKSDPLSSKKIELCKKVGISYSGNFIIKKKELIDLELLLFLKINVLNEDELNRVMLVDSLLYDEFEEAKVVARRALDFLKTRADLLLRSYKTTVEEDEVLLSTVSHQRCKMAIELRVSEKNILRDVINYCSSVFEDNKNP